MAAPFFVRVRRLTRQPLRLGSTNITNLTEGSVIDLNSRLVQNDMFRFNGRWMIVAQPRISGFSGGDQNMDPAEVTTDHTFGTGIAVFCAVKLGKGETITGLTYYSGATPLNTGTYQKAGIYTVSADGLTLTQVALSADKTNTAWAANSTQAFTGGTFPYTTPSAGTYVLGLLVVATTMPTLVGRLPVNATFANAAFTGNLAFSTLGSQATLVASVTGHAATNKIPLVQING